MRTLAPVCDVSGKPAAARPVVKEVRRTAKCVLAPEMDVARQGRLAAKAGVDVHKRQANADETELTDGMSARVESVLPGRATDPEINAVPFDVGGGLVSSSSGIAALGSARLRTCVRAPMRTAPSQFGTRRAAQVGVCSGAVGPSASRNQIPGCKASIVSAGTGPAMGGSWCCPGAAKTNHRSIFEIGILHKIPLLDLVRFEIFDVIISQTGENAREVWRYKAGQPGFATSRDKGRRSR